jgi:hypothetical protein
VLAPAVTALAWRESGRLRGDGWVHWLPVPALLWHQTEEWFLPGGFLPWFNREVLGSDDDEVPITRRLGLAINVGVGWGGTLAAAVAGPRAPGLAAWAHAMNLGNVVVHVSAASRERRWNPGLATAAALFAPLAAAALPVLARRSARQTAAGVLAGAAMSAGAFAALRRRAQVRSR